MVVSFYNTTVCVLNVAFHNYRCLCRWSCSKSSFSIHNFTYIHSAAVIRHVWCLYSDVFILLLFLPVFYSGSLKNKKLLQLVLKHFGCKNWIFNCLVGLHLAFCYECVEIIISRIFVILGTIPCVLCELYKLAMLGTLVYGLANLWLV